MTRSSKMSWISVDCDQFWMHILTPTATIKKTIQSNVLKTTINQSIWNLRKMFKQLTEREEKRNKRTEKQKTNRKKPSRLKPWYVNNSLTCEWSNHANEESSRVGKSQSQKVNTRYSSIHIIRLKWQMYRDGEQNSGCQVVEEGEGVAVT